MIVHITGLILNWIFITSSLSISNRLFTFAVMMFLKYSLFTMQDDVGKYPKKPTENYIVRVSNSYDFSRPDYYDKLSKSFDPKLGAYADFSDKFWFFFRFWFAPAIDGFPFRQKRRKQGFEEFRPIGRCGHSLFWLASLVSCCHWPRHFSHRSRFIRPNLFEALH